MYVKCKGMEKAVPVWVRYVDPAGHEHRLHVDCARRGDYGTDLVKQYGMTPNVMCTPSGASTELYTKETK